VHANALLYHSRLGTVAALRRGMIEPIRDHWVMAVALVVLVALGVWLVATRRGRSGR